jgi:hypothetical protein
VKKRTDIFSSCNFWRHSTCLRVWKHKAPTFKRYIVLCLLLSMLMTQPPHTVQLTKTLSCGCGRKTLWIRKNSSLVNFAKLSYLPGWGVSYTSVNLRSLSSSHVQCTHSKTTNGVSQNCLWWASPFYVRPCRQRHVSCTSLEPTICQRVRLLPNTLGAYWRKFRYSQ